MALLTYFGGYKIFTLNFYHSWTRSLPNTFILFSNWNCTVVKGAMTTNLCSYVTVLMKITKAQNEHLNIVVFNCEPNAKFMACGFMPPFYLENIGVKVRPSYNPTCAIFSSFQFHGHFQYSISWHRWKSAAIVTSVSKKSEQTTVVIQYYSLSRFFWNRRYKKCP